MRFRYRVVQLNRLDWRAFARRPNPVAAALMSRMRIAASDRVAVKLECLRLLASLRLDAARSRLIATFVDTYLRLGEREQTLFEGAIARVPRKEREALMELTTSWEEKGLAKGLVEGRIEGQRALVIRQLARRCGTLPEGMAARVRSLDGPTVEALAEDLLAFDSMSDLQAWFAARD